MRMISMYILDIGALESGYRKIAKKHITLREKYQCIFLVNLLKCSV